MLLRTEELSFSSRLNINGTYQGKQPRVESYRGFIFGTLNMDMPPLTEYLGGVKGPLDEWLDRHPGGKVAICEANRLKFNGNWKLAYDNSCDGYHVVFSHRSLLDMDEVARGADDPVHPETMHYHGRRDQRCADQELEKNDGFLFHGHA